MEEQAVAVSTATAKAGLSVEEAGPVYSIACGWAWIPRKRVFILSAHHGTTAYLIYDVGMDRGIAEDNGAM